MSSGCPASKKFQVLCLHGHAQTAEAFRGRIGSIRSPLKKWCDFHFLDGPFEVPPCAHSAEPARSWMQVSPDTAPNVDPKTVFESWQTSLEFIDRIIAEKQIDALLGFSLGAAMSLGVMLNDIATVSRGTNEGPETASSRYKFVALFAGFIPFKNPELEHILRAKLREVGSSRLPPSFHCYGMDDHIILAEHSEEVATFFPDACVFTHPGGHLVPSQAKNPLRDFVQLLSEKSQAP
ncbi:unnamed protein product [Amoebophrya sp. A120]|nr:unnamed protein product [Amoebophrya sp. A120]|eukprot:GSA120T00005209001.1